MSKFIFTLFFTSFFCANITQDFPKVFPDVPDVYDMKTVVPADANAGHLRYTPGTGMVFDDFLSKQYIMAAIIASINAAPPRYTPGTGEAFDDFLEVQHTDTVAQVTAVDSNVVDVPHLCADDVAKSNWTDVTTIVVQDSDKPVSGVAQSCEEDTPECKKQREEIEEFLSKLNLGRKTSVRTFEVLYVHLVGTLYYDRNLVEKVMKDSQPKYGFRIKNLNDAFENVKARSK